MARKPFVLFVCSRNSARQPAQLTPSRNAAQTSTSERARRQQKWLSNKHPSAPASTSQSGGKLAQVCKKKTPQAKAKMTEIMQISLHDAS